MREHTLRRAMCRAERPLLSIGTPGRNIAQQNQATKQTSRSAADVTLERISHVLLA